MEQNTVNKKLLDKLIEQADVACLHDMIHGSRRGVVDDPANGPFNAERVGKIIEGLTDEEREQLKDLKAEDLNFYFAGRRYRPKELRSKRVRGPIKLGKRDE